MKHKILNKIRWDFGMNTLLELENGKRFTLSSTKMYNGTTCYNIYEGENISDKTIIYEDSSLGYYGAIEFCKNYDGRVEEEVDESYEEPEYKISDEVQAELNRIQKLMDEGMSDYEAQKLIDKIKL